MPSGECITHRFNKPKGRSGKRAFYGVPYTRL